MRYTNIIIGLISTLGVCDKQGLNTRHERNPNSHDPPESFTIQQDATDPIGGEVSLSDTVQKNEEQIRRFKPGPVDFLPRGLSPRPKGPRRSASNEQRRGFYSLNCHIHNWPSAAVAPLHDAYSWMYQLESELSASGQQCHRYWCKDCAAVWLCNENLGWIGKNSIVIADHMNALFDGDNGCLDKGNSNMVQGQVSDSEGWSVLVRGGEDCSVDPGEQPIFY
ncbi:hypothetical protein F5Y19DRAFT_444041 [Xylariaceae sp. FL1651]|nr:hypothetical protein F5Y19DRAFT_444041 [Xylariaceae sp. FL1651]